MSLSLGLNEESPLKLKPAFIMWMTVFFIIITTTIALYVSTQQVWMGITFSEIKTDIQGLEILDIASESPADGELVVGDRVIAIQGIGLNEAPINITHELLIDPTTLPTLKQFDHFFVEQQAVYEAINQDKVKLILADGSQRLITPAPSRPISAIPLISWLYVATDFIGLLCGILIWSYRPRYLPAIALFYIGASYYIGMLMAVMMQRELALDAMTIKVLIIIFVFCTHTFLCGWITLQSIAPTQTISKKLLIFLVVIIIGAWLNHIFEWGDLPLHTFFLTFLLGYLVIFYLLFKQWVNTKSSPIERAKLLLYIITTMVYIATVSGLWMIPMSLGLPTTVSQKFVILTISVLLIGFTVAAVQFNLFEVEKWWFTTWFWLLSGVAIILMDLALILLLDFNKTTALGVSLLIAGFIYFPVRQWILKRIIPIQDQQLEDYLPQFVSTVSNQVSQHGFEQSWLQVVKDRFEPMNAVWSHTPSETRIKNNGLYFYIPDIQNKGHYKLTGKHMGNKLFNRDDIKLVKNLLRLMHLIEHTSNTKQKLIQKERKRVMQDMHDTVGSNLLSLSQRIKDPLEAEYVTDTLQTLRDTIHLSTSETPLLLIDVIADLRIETVERCELTNVELLWKPGSLPDDVILSISQSITVINIVREAVSNALRHASPTEIEINLSYADNQIEIAIKNNGGITDIKEWKYGSGIEGMKSRTDTMDGTFRIDAQKNYVQIFITLPIGKQTKK